MTDVRREAMYDPETFDVDGAPFPPHVLDGPCWCDPKVEAVYGRNHPKAEARIYCGDCDGVGWYEGGEAIQTQCEKCNGTGWEDGET